MRYKRQNLKNFNRIIAFFLAILLLIPCSTISVYAASPRIPSSFYVAEGGHFTIPCDLSNCKGKSVKWSTKSNCVSITEGGTVTGFSVGTATVYCTTQYGETASTTVHVIPSARISFNSYGIEMYKNTSKKINYSVSPSNAIKAVSWSSSNPSVASVDSSGTVYAKSVGSCTITCTSQDGSGSSSSLSVYVYEKETTTKRKATTKRKVTTTKKKKGSTTRRSNSNSSSSSKKKTTTQSYNYSYTPTQDYSNYQNNSSGQSVESYLDVYPDTDSSDSSNNTDSSENLNNPEPETEKFDNNDETTEVTEEYYENEYGDYTEPYDDFSDSEPNKDFAIKAISKKNNPLNIQWKKVNGAEEYELYCFENGTDKQLRSIYTGTKCSYDKHCFVYGNDYYFMVVAYKTVDEKKVPICRSNIVCLTAVKQSLFKNLFS